jgi:hypothetical protein
MGNSTSSSNNGGEQHSDEYDEFAHDVDDNDEAEDEHNNDNDDDEYAKQFDGIETLGYRVLGVQPDSPGKFYYICFIIVFLSYRVLDSVWTGLDWVWTQYGLDSAWAIYRIIQMRSKTEVN